MSFFILDPTSDDQDSDTQASLRQYMLDNIQGRHKVAVHIPVQDEQLKFAFMQRDSGDETTYDPIDGERG